MGFGWDDGPVRLHAVSPELCSAKFCLSGGLGGWPIGSVQVMVILTEINMALFPMRNFNRFLIGRAALLPPLQPAQCDSTPKQI